MLLGFCGAFWLVLFAINLKKASRFCPSLVIDRNIITSRKKEEKMLQYFADIDFRRRESMEWLILVNAKRMCCSAKDILSATKTNNRI